jgi:hypothetical protein
MEKHMSRTTFIARLLEAAEKTHESDHIYCQPLILGVLHDPLDALTS